jgi:hypothetical protein
MPKGKNKSATALKWIKLQYSTVTPGANKGFVGQIQNLSDELESLAVTDAYKVRVTKISLDIIAYCDTPFYHQFCVVQTNDVGFSGTTVNLANETVHTLLDNAIDTDFGIYHLGNARVSVPIPHNSGGGAMMFGCRYRVDIPQHIIQLLNKEASTEKLQYLMTAFAGVAYSAANTISLFHGIELHYTIVPRSLAVR